MRREFLIFILIMIIITCGISLFFLVEKINSLAALVNVKPAGIEEEINISLLFSILTVTIIIICVMILVMFLLNKNNKKQI